MARIVFTPSGLDGEVASGTTVLDAARALGVDLDSVCGGRGICGRCQVVAGAGTFPKWGLTADAEALNPPGDTERDYRGLRPIVEGRRLGCAATVCSDVVIDVPPASQIHKQVVRKDLDLGEITLDPVVELHYLEPPRVELGHDATATDLITDGLRSEWGIEHAVVAAAALADVHRIMHNAATADGGGLTVALRQACDPQPSSPHGPGWSM